MATFLAALSIRRRRQWRRKWAVHGRRSDVNCQVGIKDGEWRMPVRPHDINRITITKQHATVSESIGDAGKYWKINLNWRLPIPVGIWGLAYYYYNEQYNEVVIYLNRRLIDHAVSLIILFVAEAIELPNFLVIAIIIGWGRECRQEIPESGWNARIEWQIMSGVAKMFACMQGKCLIILPTWDEAWSLVNEGVGQ